MEIIEKYLQGKRKDGKGCEDGYLITDDYVVVVDGATSYGATLYDYEGQPVSSGEFAKEIILFEMQEMEAGISADMCMRKLHEALQQRTMEQKGLRHIDEIDLVDQPRASLLIYSIQRQEIWALGDCNYSVNDHTYIHDKKVDVIIAEVRSMLIRSQLLAGKTEEELLANDVSREWIRPLICQQYALENQADEYGYPELNCTSFEPTLIEVVKVEAGDEIVLATDGYPEVRRTLSESEECLRQQLISDPLMYKYHKVAKGTVAGNVSYDDRCYVRLRG